MSIVIIDSDPDNPAHVAFQRRIEQLSELTELLKDHRDHPNFTMISHMADVMVGVATVISQSDEDGLTMTDWRAALPHLCSAHLDAAVYLIACTDGYKGGDTTQPLADAIGYVKQALKTE